MRFFRIPSFTGIESHRDDADRGSLRAIEGCLPHGPGGVRSAPVWEDVGTVDMFSSNNQNMITASDDGNGNSLIFNTRNNTVTDIGIMTTENVETGTFGACYLVSNATQHTDETGAFGPIGNRMYAIGDGTHEAIYVGKGPPANEADVFPDEQIYSLEWSRFPRCKFYVQGPNKTIFAAGNPEHPLTVYISEPAGSTNKFVDSPYSTEASASNYAGMLSTVDILGSKAEKITALSANGSQVIVHTDKGCHVLYAPSADQANTGFRVEQAPSSVFSGAVSSRVVSSDNGSMIFWLGHDGQIYKDESASRGSEDAKKYTDPEQASWKSKGLWDKNHPADLSKSFAFYCPQSGYYWVFIKAQGSLDNTAPNPPTNLIGTTQVPSAPTNLLASTGPIQAPSEPTNLVALPQAPSRPTSLIGLPQAPSAPTDLVAVGNEKPITGPSNLAAAVQVAPVTGPSNLAALLAGPPLTGPSNLTAAVQLVPSVGPSNLAAVFNTPVAGPSNLAAADIPPIACGTDLPDTFCLELSNTAYSDSKIYLQRNPLDGCFWSGVGQIAGSWYHPFDGLVSLSVDNNTGTFNIDLSGGGYYGSINELLNELPKQLSFEGGETGSMNLGWQDTYVYTLSVCSVSNSANPPVTGPSNLSANIASFTKWDWNMLVDWEGPVYMGYSESLEPSGANFGNSPEDITMTFTWDNDLETTGGTLCGGFPDKQQRYVCGETYRNAQNSAGEYLVTANNVNSLMNTGDGTARNPYMNFRYSSGPTGARQEPTLSTYNGYGHPWYQTWTEVTKATTGRFGGLFTSWLQEENRGFNLVLNNTGQQSGFGIGWDIVFGDAEKSYIAQIIYDDIGTYGGGYVVLLAEDWAGSHFKTYKILRKLDNFSNAKDPWNPFGTYAYSDGVFQKLIHITTEAFDAQTLDSATADRPAGFNSTGSIGEQCYPYSVRYAVPNSTEGVIEVDCVNIKNYL